MIYPLRWGWKIPLTLHIANGVQTDLYGKIKVGKSCDLLEEKSGELEGEIDLLILPEMFPRIFQWMRRELCWKAHEWILLVTKWMSQLATQLKMRCHRKVLIIPKIQILNNRFSGVSFRWKCFLLRLSAIYFECEKERIKKFFLSGGKNLPILI